MELTLTGMIAIRLLIHYTYIRDALGDKYSAKYVKIATILVESQALMSSFTVFFLVAYAVESPVVVMVPFILTQVQVGLLVPPIESSLKPLHLLGTCPIIGHIPSY